MAKILEVIRKLDSWIGKNGWAGWDPYDLKGRKPFIYLERQTTSLFRKIICRLIYEGVDIFPLLTRKAFAVKPQVNAKAMALFALSYIRFHLLTRKREYLNKYYECVKWLTTHNHTRDEAYLGWGYPFDWQSLIFIPKETPLCVPTVLAGHAFLDAFELLDDETNIPDIERIKNFLVEKLNKTVLENGDHLCFSYSPIDDFLVINANLYTASFLTRYATLFQNEKVLMMARKARSFSISQQQVDGSWQYWSPLYHRKCPMIIDNYHTGIVLQWLKMVSEYDSVDCGEKKAIDKGAQYYFKNFFDDDGLPHYTIEKKFPVDIHGSAQSLVTFNYLRDKVNPQLVKKVYDFTVNNMRAKDGYFYYRIKASGRVIKTPFLRWSQAWMFYGLTNLLEYCFKTKKCAEF